MGLCRGTLAAESVGLVFLGEGSAEVFDDRRARASGDLSKKKLHLKVGGVLLAFCALEGVTGGQGGERETGNSANLPLFCLLGVGRERRERTARRGLRSLERAALSSCVWVWVCMCIRIGVFSLSRHPGGWGWALVRYGFTQGGGPALGNGERACLSLSLRAAAARAVVPRGRGGGRGGLGEKRRGLGHARGRFVLGEGASNAILR